MAVSIDYNALATALLRAGLSKDIAAFSGEVCGQPTQLDTQTSAPQGANASGVLAPSGSEVKLQPNQQPNQQCQAGFFTDPNDLTIEGGTKGGFNDGGASVGANKQLEGVSRLDKAGSYVGSKASTESGRGGVSVECRGTVEDASTDEPVDWDDVVASELSASGQTVSDISSESGGSVSFVCGKPQVNPVARMSFGMAEDYQAEQVTEAPKGYFATVVRSDRAISLRHRLEKLCGVSIPKRARESLAVCTFTAGCMPDVLKDGKKRLRMLAVVGDASLSLHLAVGQCVSGASAENSQSLRARVTSNRGLQDIMISNDFVKYVAYPSGQDPAMVISTATAFEAILGVLTLYVSHEAVREFLRSVGFQL